MTRVTRAFTLIELLVVIAIIAILAAILFPVFAQAKVAAKKAVDISNMKQQQLAFLMYSNDYDDLLPIAFPQNNLGFYTTPWNRVTPPSQLSANLRQNFWTNAVYPYKKNYQLDAIPVGTNWNLFNIAATTNPMNYADGYTMNTYVQAQSTSGLPSPADVVVLWPGDGKQNAYGYGASFPLWYLADVGFPSIGNPAQLITFQANGPSCVANLGVWSGFASGDWTYNLFNNGFDMAYADGHAKFVNAASGRSPWASVDSNGYPTSWWVNSTDSAAGCGYLDILSPFFSGN